VRISSWFVVDIFSVWNQNQLPFRSFFFSLSYHDQIGLFQFSEQIFNSFLSKKKRNEAFLQRIPNRNCNENILELIWENFFSHQMTSTLFEEKFYFFSWFFFLSFSPSTLLFYSSKPNNIFVVVLFLQLYFLWASKSIILYIYIYTKRHV